MGALDQAMRDVTRAEALTAELGEPESFDDEIVRLAQLNHVEYDRAREQSAEKLGIRLSTLDKLVLGACDKTQPNDETNGTTVALEDPELWPEPIGGQKLLDDLAAIFRRHLVLPVGAADGIALWVLHAHALDSAAISPILGITSPTPECGKTTLLTLLGALVPRPLHASNVTASVLFRAVEKWRPTLLIDEADTYLRDSNDLRGVINSGHMRESAWILRNAKVGDDYEPKWFRTWSPKAVALIGRLPATLESRAIHIKLRRMAPDEDVAQLRPDRVSHLEPLCRQSWRWAADHAEALRAADPDMGGLRGRLADNWRALYAIADVCGGKWPTCARRAAEALSAGRSEQTAGIMLLDDMRRLMAGLERMASADLVEALCKLEDRPWPEWGRSQRSITPRQVAQLLEPFGIRPRPLRYPDGRVGVRGYSSDQLRDAWVRYLPSSGGHQSATPLHASDGAASGDTPTATGSPHVAGQVSRNPNDAASCSDVADGKPQVRRLDI